MLKTSKTTVLVQVLGKIHKSEKWIFTLALLVRLLLTAFGIYHDSKVSRLDVNQDVTQIVPKYTDIDYQVFSDAAQYVYEGESPYRRETYRYTPLLAYLMLPNSALHESFGKLVFVALDLVAAYLVLVTNRLESQKQQLKEDPSSLSSSNSVALEFALLNPITLAISSRGNAESIMACLVLGFVYCLKKRAYTRAGLLYGLAIHFKIYPITYALVILLHLVRFDKLRFGDFDSIKSNVLFNVGLYKFGFASLFTLVSLTSIFYQKYGYEFLFETYLYHLSRQDIRHNFSPYFYALYLTGADSAAADSLLIKVLNFLPQLVLVLAISIYMHQHLEFALFSITFMFVTFNKVCTSQYFVWYLSLIPILIPRLKINWKSSIIYFLLWILGQAIWLYFAFELEFRGRNTFLEIWMASLFFASINCYILKYCFIDNYNFNVIHNFNIKIKKN